MAITTMVPIHLTTLTSTQSSVVINNIPQSYTNLLLRVTGISSRTETDDGYGLTFNTDTSTGSTSYSDTYAYGANSSMYSTRSSSYRNINLHQVGGATGDSSLFPLSDTFIANYSNSATYKSIIAYGGLHIFPTMTSGTWRNTSPITVMTIFPGYNGSGYTFASGSTFELYGMV